MWVYIRAHTASDTQSHVQPYPRFPPHAHAHVLGSAHVLHRSVRCLRIFFFVTKLIHFFVQGVRWRIWATQRQVCGFHFKFRVVILTVFSTNRTRPPGRLLRRSWTGARCRPPTFAMQRGHFCRARRITPTLRLRRHYSATKHWWSIMKGACRMILTFCVQRRPSPLFCVSSASSAFVFTGACEIKWRSCWTRSCYERNKRKCRCCRPSGQTRRPGRKGESGNTQHFQYLLYGAW